MEQSKDFDQRLGTVLNLAFQHSKNLDSTFKVRSTSLKKQKTFSAHKDFKNLVAN